MYLSTKLFLKVKWTFSITSKNNLITFQNDFLPLQYDTSHESVVQPNFLDWEQVLWKKRRNCVWHRRSNVRHENIAQFRKISSSFSVLSSFKTSTAADVASRAQMVQLFFFDSFKFWEHALCHSKTNLSYLVVVFQFFRIPTKFFHSLPWTSAKICMTKEPTILPFIALSNLWTTATCQQRPQIWGPSGGCCTQVWL